MVRAVWLALVLAGACLAACAPSPEDQALDLCQPLCRCNDVPLPSEQAACNASCERRFAMHPSSDACIDCVVEHTDRCPTLAQDCTPLCTQPMTARAQERVR